MMMGLGKIRAEVGDGYFITNESPKMISMPDPSLSDPDLIPLAEFQAAMELAGGLGMCEEKKVIEEYLRERIRRMVQIVREKPRPM